jgi:hypothetical protein
VSVSPEAKKEPKPYVSPALTRHGDVESLTRAVTPRQGTSDDPKFKNKTA